MQELRNIGIFAHVDAGKTTLSERMLVVAGAVRSAGAVDSGTAHTDRMDIERRRGISVVATTARLSWKGVRINLIDTPGHADFQCEVERSLWALDGAVLVLSGVEGVQPQSEVLFRAMKARGLPVLVFVNKLDREGADAVRVAREAGKVLGQPVALLRDDEALMELLAESDEMAMEAFLAGQVWPRDRLITDVARLTRAGLVSPALCGSALRGEGIAPLLDAIVDLLPPPAGDSNGPLCGAVYAVEPGGAMGRAAHVRLFSGAMKNRDPLTLSRLGEDGIERKTEAKVTQIRDVAVEGPGADTGVLRAGEIGTVYGLGDVRAGEIIGERALLPHRIAAGELGAPLLMVKVEVTDPAQKPGLRAALSQLAAEDPLLMVADYGGESHIKVMGAIQLEVLSEVLRDRFGLRASFGPRHIIYRETIAQKAVGFYAYTMPKPCWAVLKFEIEPLPRGSGIRYASVVPPREIMPRYQHQVEQAIPLAIRQGMLGWQVDDVAITLIAGEHHLIHTHPLDFIVCTPIAFLDGMRRGGSQLLEPVMEMRIAVPGDSVGRVMSEVVAMRGEVCETDGAGDVVTLVARVPMATSVDFPVRLPQLTAGRGALSVRHVGYQDAPEGVVAVSPRRGTHPLDTSAYILASRSALDGNIFND